LEKPGAFRALDDQQAVLPMRSALEGVAAVVEPITLLERDEVMGHRLRFMAKSSGTMVDDQILDLARLAGALSQLSLACVRGALDWADKRARTAIHIDLEMDALTQTFAAGLLEELPEASLRKRFRFFIPAKDLGEQGALAAPAIKVLRDAGFGFGLRDVGGGGTSMEDLTLLQPAWIRLSWLLSDGVGKTKGRRQQLQLWIEMLEPLKAPILADHVSSKDLAVLKNLGLHSAVLTP
jgi:EAL domain-containing protein (putative c-di-GMP-specific phosphodiesterase class I)